MIDTTALARWATYPMGPKLRDYLGIGATEYRGGEASTTGVENSAELTDFLRTYHPTAKVLPPDAVVDLMDELVSMDLARAVLDLADHYPETSTASDFRAQLSLAVAAMLTGDLANSEARFRTAQELLPEEPAPYVNLAQIMLTQNRLAEAELWTLAGLDAEPNNLNLWDLIAVILREVHGEYMPDRLMALADKRCAWAGLSLAANLTTTGDRYLKATLLERLYSQGERDPQFLVELTGAHGVAGDFGKIPPLVWQAERLATKGVPWQLHIHCAQAQLALNEAQAALSQLAKAKTDASMPPEARAAVSELEEEAAAQLRGDDQATHH